MKENYLAIPLGKIDLGETDRLYTFYTREKGLIRMKARGIRKPHARLAPHVEEFVLTHITVAQNYGFGTLAGGVSEQSFTALRSDYTSLVLLSELGETLIHLVRGEERDEHIFSLLVTLLHTADDALVRGEDHTSYLIDCFLIHLYDRLGYRFPLTTCAICGTRIAAGEHSFNAYAGGVLCNTCARSHTHNMMIHEDTLKTLRLINQFDLVDLQKVEVTPIVLRQLRLVTAHISMWIMR